MSGSQQWDLSYAVSVEKLFKILMAQLTTAADIYFLLQSVRIHLQHKPWINGKLKYYISKPQQAFTRLGKD